MAEIIVENDGTDTIIIDSKEFSEQTVKAALAVYMLVEKPKPVIRIFGDEGVEQDIYLRLENDADEIDVVVVDKDGNWQRTLCWFDTKGLHICDNAEDVGFPTDERGCIKVVND